MPIRATFEVVASAPTPAGLRRCTLRQVADRSIPADERLLRDGEWVTQAVEVMTDHPGLVAGGRVTMTLTDATD